MSDSILAIAVVYDIIINSLIFSFSSIHIYPKAAECIGISEQCIDKLIHSTIVFSLFCPRYYCKNNNKIKQNNILQNIIIHQSSVNCSRQQFLYQYRKLWPPEEPSCSSFVHAGPILLTLNILVSLATMTRTQDYTLMWMSWT